MHELTYKKDVRTKKHQKNVMAMASHHPREEASQRQGEGDNRDDPLRHMRVSSADEHQRTNQEDVQNKPYQENGSCAKNVMMMALRHSRDRRNQTTSPTLTLMQGASRGQGVGEPQEDRDDPLRHGGGGGHN